MKNKTFISRMLVFMLALILTFTFIPPNLIAFAGNLGGIGAGQSQSGSGGGSTGNNDSLLNHEIGLRFSLVTLKNGKRTVVETKYSGKYFIDAWCDGTNLDNIYSVVTSNTRYATENGKGAEYNTIINDTSSGISSYVNTWLKAKYNVTGKFNLSSALFDGQSEGNAIFNEWLYGGTFRFSVSGLKFYNWAMGTPNKVNGENIANMEAFINCFYSNKLGSLNLKETFLTVEPIIYYADLNGTEATGKKSVATAYGYISRQQANGYDPGQAWAIHGRLAKVVNGFCFGSETDNEVLTSLKKVLGLAPPNGNYYPETSSFFNFGDRMDLVGLGIQAFWLDSFAIESGTPIDTYNIINNPTNTPSNAEPPSKDNQTDGDKSIIKLYVDLYKDPETGLYTQIVDKAQFVQQNTSDKVTITDEEPINGYKVSAWYTSDTAYNSLPLGSSMLATTNIGNTDGTVNLLSLGGQQLRLNNYTTATDYPNTGGQKYFSALSSPHGTYDEGLKAQISTGATNYTQYKRLAVKGKSNYGSYDYSVNENGTTVSLGDANTIVILYTREMSYISTTDTTTNESTDERENNSGNLTIVKVYGTIDPSTYEISDISRTVLSKTTRNVNIKNESGYNFAEWIYLTGGAGTEIKASTWGNPLTYPTDYDTDQLYRLDGFVDNFKNTYNSQLSQYFRFKDSITLPKIYTITGSNGLNDNETAGRYSIGSRSGIGNNSYNSTIYFGGEGSLADNTPDNEDTNDVLKPIGLYFFAFFQKNN